MRLLSKEGRALVLGVSIIFVLAACGSNSSNSSNSGDGLPASIKIGVPLDTSGSAAVAGVGNAELSGVKLAVDEINSSQFLGSSKIDLDVQDTKADKQQAVATVNKFVQGGKHAIVGFTLTPSFLAAGPIAQQANVPVMTVGLSAVGVTDVGDYIFRIYPDLTRLFKASDADFVKSVNAKTVAFLYGNDTETTVGQYKFRQKETDGLGLKTVSVQTVTAKDTDVRAQLTEIKNAKPDVLFLNVNTGQQPGILVQAKELGLLPGDTQIIGDVGFGNDTVLKQAASALQCGLFATTWDASSKDGKNEHFIQLFKDKNGGKMPDAFAAWGYDAMWAVATAFKNAGTTDHKAVRDALAGLKDLQGALGVYSFDDNRQPTQKGLLMQVQDGKPVIWTPGTTCKK